MSIYQYFWQHLFSNLYNLYVLQYIIIVWSPCHSLAKDTEVTAEYC